MTHLAVRQQITYKVRRRPNGTGHPTMATQPKQPTEKIEVEPGADKRLSGILKRALNTPPPRHAEAKTKSKKTK